MEGIDLFIAVVSVFAIYIGGLFVLGYFLKRNAKKNWSMVCGRTHPPYEFICYLAVFFGILPVMILLRKPNWWGVVIALLLGEAALLAYIASLQLELRDDCIFVRNIFRIKKVIRLENIIEVFELANPRGGFSAIMFRLVDEIHPVRVAVDIDVGIPELLTIIDKRYPGVVNWHKMPSVSERIQIANKKTK